MKLALLAHIFWIISIVGSLDVGDIVVVILSQINEYHTELAKSLKEDILQQAVNETRKPTVHISSEDFPHEGAWTILPLIPSLVSLHGNNSSFVFFIEDKTVVRLNELVSVLQKYNDQDAFVGFALHDREPSIIHHFAFYKNPESFKYPNIASGFAVSTQLLLRLFKRLLTNITKTDFNIDTSHEFALFVRDHGTNVSLKHEPKFCVTQRPDCARYPKPFEPCDRIVNNNNIYFAVKTCHHFHSDRVPVVKKTWAKRARFIEFFSDREDSQIPTVVVGVRNTEQGHCEKTMAIIRKVVERIRNEPDIFWIVVADDDTIMGVSNLQKLLSCYNSSDLVALGERYGYGVRDTTGYNYPTGGAGMVFSRPLLEKLANSKTCRCPSATSPDDMVLGLCLKQMDVALTHSPSFHQARPMDYAAEYLESHGAVSFHKHWMMDPVEVYKQWFGDDGTSHTEL